MIHYFTNETDPSIGKLYINYPMMESYRFCDNFSDESFISAKINIEQMHEFKRLADSKKLSGKSVENIHGMILIV